MDINKLVSEAEHGMKGNLVEDAITEDAREFSETAMKNYLKKFDNGK